MARAGSAGAKGVKDALKTARWLAKSHKPIVEDGTVAFPIVDEKIGEVQAALEAARSGAEGSDVRLRAIVEVRRHAAGALPRKKPTQPRKQAPPTAMDAAAAEEAGGDEGAEEGLALGEREGDQHRMQQADASLLVVLSQQQTAVTAQQFHEQLAACARGELAEGGVEARGGVEQREALELVDGA